MQKREQKFQVMFGKWIHENWKGGSACFELKVAKGDTILLSAFRQHQIVSLLAAKRGKLHHKISDGSYGFLPFDSFVLCKSEAYGVIQFLSGVVMLDVELLITKQKWSYREAIEYGKRIW